MSSSDPYRELLQQTEHKSQESYDKAVIALSGGALGISFSFLDKIIPPAEAVGWGWMIGAWIAWAASLTVMVASFYCSTRSARIAIFKYDVLSIGERLPVGKGWDRWTGILNFLGGVLFLIGLVMMIRFVHMNIGTTKESAMPKVTANSVSVAPDQRGLLLPIQPPDSSPQGSQTGTGPNSGSGANSGSSNGASSNNNGGAAAASSETSSTTSGGSQ